MLQMLPLIAGLLEGNKKEADQRKQNQINTYMGEAPSAQPQQGGGLLSGLAGMFGGKKKPQQFQDPGVPSDLGYDATPPAPEDEIL